MTRTAYGIAPYGPDSYRATVGPDNMFANEGYIVAYNDARGSFRIEGEFIHPRSIVERQIDEVSDTYDTIKIVGEKHSQQQRARGTVGLGDGGAVGQWGSGAVKQWDSETVER